MTIIKHKGSKYFYTQFSLNGHKYLKSTRTTNRAKAELFEERFRAALEGVDVRSQSEEQQQYLLTLKGKKEKTSYYTHCSHWIDWKLPRVKAVAKRRGIEFNLTSTDIKVPTHCPVLGYKLDYSIEVGTGKGLGSGGEYAKSNPTFDRIDNKLGYVPGNVIIVSQRANVLKRDASIQELHCLLSFYSNTNRIKQICQ